MRFVPPPKLGVGFTYQRGLPQAIRRLVNFYEVSPDVLCRERVIGGERVLSYHEDLLDEALEAIAGRPVIVHGLGLSIGSAAGWNAGYLRILDGLHARCPFVWHSEHLAFLLAQGPDGRTLHTGVPLPLPFTEEALDLLAPRARALGERYGVPFLLENFTYYLPGLPSDGGRDEVAFLNDLTERSGCGLLLDLYNFYCNAVNFGFDPVEALGRLKLERVVEIHLAGGAVHDGFHMDVHSQVVPEPVWALLDWVAPRAPNLAAIVYEVLEQAVPLVGYDAVGQQLERARAVWERDCARVEAYALA
ncbi:MAG TPA: DUF692 family protein [Blastocatellia bacterium]|jgi:uncharacterized protein|nr:DUF692 family protein [Blastocatellia bacterium]